MSHATAVSDAQDFRTKINQAKNLLIEFVKNNPDYESRMGQTTRLTFDAVETALVWAFALVGGVMNLPKELEDAAAEALKNGNLKVVEGGAGKEAGATNG